MVQGMKYHNKKGRDRSRPHFCNLTSDL